MRVSRDSLLLCGGLNLFDSHNFCFSLYFFVTSQILSMGFCGRNGARRKWVLSRKKERKKERKKCFFFLKKKKEGIIHRLSLNKN
jgi:hypothetical protein